MSTPDLCAEWARTGFNCREFTDVVRAKGERAELLAALKEAVGHMRSVWPARGVFYPRCSCGWLGTPFMFREAAQAAPCEVEMLLTDSAERARRILQG